MEELRRYLRALLMLELWNVQEAARRAGTAPPKLELLLSESGFAHKETSELLGKSTVAVAKAVSRGRAARRSGSQESQSDEREAPDE